MTRVPIPARLRRETATRASYQCEYCLLSEKDSTARHTIDHIRAVKHKGLTVIENLALACSDCNSNKGSDIAAIDPKSQQLIRLFDPRRDVWSEHFAFDNASIVGLTILGRATVELLKFNTPTRMSQRAFLQSIGRYPA